MNTQEISDPKIGARVRILPSSDHVHHGKTGVVVRMVSTDKTLSVIPRIRVKFDDPTNDVAECAFFKHELEAIK